MDLDVLLPDIKRKIGDFERDFLQKEGRKPTKSDIEAVPSVLRYYKFYEKSRRHQASLTGSGSTDTDVQSPKPQPPILTPSKVWSNKLNKTNNSSTTESGPNSPHNNSTLSAITVKLRKLTREHMEQELVSTTDKRVNYSLAAKRAHLNEKRILQQNKKKMEKEEEASRKMEEEKVSREKEIEEEDSSIEIIEDSGYVEQHESAISTPSTSLSGSKAAISTPFVHKPMVSTISTQSGTDHAHTLSNLTISTPSTSLSGTKFAALYSRYASMNATISTSFGSNLLATSTPVAASKPTRIFLSDLIANSPRLNPTAIFTTLASISTPPALTTRPSVESASSTSSTSSSVLFDDEPFELDSTNEAIKQSIIPIIIEGDDGQPIRETLQEHTPKVPPPVFGLDDDGAYSGSFRKWRKHEEKYGQTKVKERKFFKNLFTESALEEEEVSRKKMKEDEIEEVPRKIVKEDKEEKVSRKNVFDFVVDDPIDVKVVVEPPEVEFLPQTSTSKVTATKSKGNKKAMTSAVPKVNYRRLQMKKKCFAKGKGKFNMKRYRFKQWKADTWTAKKRQQIKSYQDEIVSIQQRMIQEQDVPEEVATGGSSLVRMIKSSGALFDDQEDSELNELLSDASMAFGLDLGLVHEDVLLVTKRILTGESSLLVNTCSIAQRHLAYHLPTYCYWNIRKSISIVITPLRSLNADHWANFPEKCVLKPVCINSEQSDAERKRSVKSLISGQAQLLFLSLEYVAIGTILAILTQDGFPEVSLVYLDQAEGLVEWSSDFRPGLLHLLNILHLQFGVKNILAGVDSSVTRESRLKICRNLGLDPALDVIGPDFELSPKLKLDVTKTNDKLNVLAGLLRADPYVTQQTVMILANRKETCDQLETQLRSLLQVDLINQKGKSNRIVAFHEGTVPYQRAQIKKDFRRKKIRFLISTFPFGLGLTKPASRDGGLRAVICYSMPESFELFAQVLSRVNIPGSEDDDEHSSAHVSLSYAHVLIDKSGQELIQLLNDKCYRNGMDRWSVKRLVELVYAPCKCKWFAAQEVDDEPMEVDSDTELDLDFLKTDYEVKPENGVDPTQSHPQVCSDIGATIISSQTGSGHAQIVSSNATISTQSASIDATISTEDSGKRFDEVNPKVTKFDDPQADVDLKLKNVDCDDATISTPCVSNPIGAAISTQDESKSRSSSDTIDLDDELEWIDDEEEVDSDVEVKIVERVKWVKPVFDPLLTTMIELVDDSGSTQEVLEEAKEPVICPRHLVAFPLTSTELELDIRSEVIYSLLAALELGGGLPIAHASIRLEAPTLSVCTVVNFGDEEQFEQIVKRSAALRLGMDLRRRECEQNSYVFTPNNFRFSVVEVARLMGKEVREVKSELGKLEWIQADARNSSKSSRKSCINVRFSEFSYVVSASGILSPEELDSVTDYLDGTLKRAEQTEVWKLQQLYSRFAKSADAPGPIGSNMLKEFLNYYFLEDSRLDRLSPEVYQRGLPCSFKLDNHDLDSINGTLCQLIDLYYEENGVNSPRKVARILQGIESPKFPAKIWRGVKHFWGTLPGMHFAQLMDLARESLQERYQQGRKFC